MSNEITHRARVDEKRRSPHLELLAQDVKFAFRTLLRQKLAAVIAILCLALGIGATTTVFSVANTLLLRPLPFVNGHRVVSVGSIRANEARPGVTSLPDFMDWRARQSIFQEMAAFTSANFTLLTGGEPARIPGTRATVGLFRVLGVRAMRGRLFSDADGQPGAAPVAVVSGAFAERHLNGTERALGARININGELKTVVGIIPDQQRLPEWSEIWTPIVLDPSRESRGNRFLEMVGLLSRGVTAERAQREMSIVARSVASEHPEDDGAVAVALSPLRDRYVGAARPAFLLISAAAALVFLIACANVASLQLARASARSREVNLRAALGASRSRLVRQLLTESVLLALIGGTLGVWLAVFGSSIIAKSIAGALPAWMTFAVDMRVLVFTLSVSAAAGILFGLAPAANLTRGNHASALREGGAAGMDLTRGRLYRGLITAEIALSLVLLVGASLAQQSFSRLQRVDPGYQAEGLVAFHVTLRGPRYDESSQRARFISEVIERARSIRGISYVAAVSHVPIAGCCSRFGFQIEGREVESGSMPMATGNLVTPDYLRAMRIPLLRGRDFNTADGRDAPRVTIVSETFASRFWPGEEALGKRIHLGSDWWTIIGIAKDIKQTSLVDVPEPQFYRPHAQEPWDDMWFAIRAQSEAASLAPALRAAVASVDPTLPAYSFTSMTDVMSGAIAAQRLYGRLFAMFALVAFALAAAGIYGVTAFYVSRRTGEIGIRMALGADKQRVLRLVLKQSVSVAAVGLLLGLGASVLAARALSHVLFGVTAAEPFTYIGAATLLGVTVLAASYAPARRATAINPTTALRPD